VAGLAAGRHEVHTPRDRGGEPAKEAMSPVESPRPPLSSLDGQQVICPSCRRSNVGQQQFCTHCGAPLWAICLACGERCMASQEYCGTCGAGQAALLEQRLGELQHALERADELESTGQLRDAALALRRVRPLAHHKLEPLQQQVRQRLETLQQQMQQQQQEALSRFDSLPPPFKEDEYLQRIIGVARDRRRELLALKEEIRGHVAHQQYVDLLPKIERFQVLSPGNTEIQALSQRISKRVVEQLHTRLAEHQYDEAFRLAQAIPATARSAPLQELCDQAAELAALQRSLRYSPLADAALVGIAQRLVEAAPGNQQTARLLDELKRRASGTEPVGRFNGVVWARPPLRTSLGLPVDWMGGFGRLRAKDATAAEQLAAHPGAFFTAAGLALQGLGRGPIKINLASSRGWFALPKLSLRSASRGTRAAWGLDLGDAALKVVKLAMADEGAEPELVAADFVPHSHPLSQPGQETRRSETLRETLASFCSRHSVQKGEMVCLNFPSDRTLSRTLSLPNVGLKKLEALMRHEIPHQIPIPETERVWDFAQLGSDVGGEESYYFQRRVILLAAKKTDVTQRLRTCQEAQLHIDVLQSGVAALHNFVVFDGLAAESPQPLPEKTVATIDVGSQTTSVLVSSLDHVWLRTLRLGGADFTRARAGRLHLTHEQAERLQRQPSRATSFRQLCDALTPVFQQISDEIQRTLASYEKEVPDQPIGRICVIGEGARMHGLLRYFIFGP
jgi:type IV pilus assembly protein PilM